MRFVTVQDPTPIPYAAGQARTLLIGSQEFFITGLLMDLDLAKTDGAGPTTYQDFMYRAITGLGLKGGGIPYIDIGSPDARVLYWATRQRLQGRGRTPDMQAGAVTLRHQLCVLFGVNPIMGNDGINYFDPTAAIKPDQDLTLRINWAANTAIGANRTIDPATQLRITYLGYVAEKPEEQPRWYPSWSVVDYQPGQAFTNKGGISKLPTGDYYRRSTIMILNGASPNDVRTDGLGASAVSEIGAKTKDGRFGIDMAFSDFVQKSQAQFSVADDNSAVPGAVLAPGAAVVGVGYNAGVGQIDWAQQADTSPAPEGQPVKADPLYGINMVGKSDGALSLAYTVNVNVNTRIVQLHESYMPYK